MVSQCQKSIKTYPTLTKSAMISGRTSIANLRLLSRATATKAVFGLR